MSTPISRRCTKCGRVKLLTNFWKVGTTRAKYGRSARCNVCRRKSRNDAYSKLTGYSKALYLLRSKEYTARKKKANPAAYKMECRQFNLMSAYGITIAEYNALMKSQKHRCLICRIHKDELTRGLVVDHCHDTGKVRGLLCQRCNTAIGMIDDSPQMCARASMYLMFHVGRADPSE